MKIAVCAIMKDENQYIEEWSNHYKNLGFDHIFIYDNNSKIPLVSEKDYITIVNWPDDKFKSQSRSYLSCAKNEGKDYDYILFIDADEFYMSKSMNIHKDIENLKNKYGDFDGLGLYWRIYGQPKPYLEKRQAIEKYTQYFGNTHIKSLLKPKLILDFPDPHKGHLKPGSKYIDELNRTVVSPIGLHTSEDIYIKHIFTRSKEEFKDKLERGDANLRGNYRTWEDFNNYNDLCINKD